MARAVRDLLEQFPLLNGGNIVKWFDTVDSILASYVQSRWPVQHHGGSVTVNATVLSALPFFRRVLLSQLTEAWILEFKQKLPADLEPRVARLIEQLYGLHRDHVVAKGIVEYFHISKSGGTSWNAAAKMNGCNYAHGGGAHVRAFGDECRWMDQSFYKETSGGLRVMWARWGRVARTTKLHGCMQRYDFIVSRGFSYISNEYTLHGGVSDMYDAHVCPQVVNVVTLREPLARMESAMRFIMMHVKSGYRRHKRPNGEQEFDKVWCNASAEFWRSMGPPISDNYNVRSFLGEQGFHTPIGQLGPEHLEVAKHQLVQFDLVFDLNSGEDANDREAWLGLGWPAALSRAHALDHQVLSAKMDLDYHACHPHPDGMHELKRAQRPDVELYAFGRVLNRLDMLWLELAAATGQEPVPDSQRLLHEDAGAKVIKCGMLWRGSNTSVLAKALDKLVGDSAEVQQAIAAWTEQEASSKGKRIRPLGDGPEYDNVDPRNVEQFNSGPEHQSDGRAQRGVGLAAESDEDADGTVSADEAAQQAAQETEAQERAKPKTKQPQEAEEEEEQELEQIEEDERMQGWKETSGQRGVVKGKTAEEVAEEAAENESLELDQIEEEERVKPQAGAQRGGRKEQAGGAGASGGGGAGGGIESGGVKGSAGAGSGAAAEGGSKGTSFLQRVASALGLGGRR
ncbi:hypothetical protein HYH03_014642 [Edaphochlamys debaryana]|uniref:Uncharacterized protein n=1 Tax=Edaphochlamys debaryana TaxID=47281 RepID=A0A836BTD0_9CHLO|nr:hypothetical protein HYH03_014642 [Edaphochlamys debaryana]|eukprot:KAG2486714.1 hypothetical protein HYH03_014642 [Edaphochlamys debaryana]